MHYVMALSYYPVEAFSVDVCICAHELLQSTCDLAPRICTVTVPITHTLKFIILVPYGLAFVYIIILRSFQQHDDVVGRLFQYSN